MDPLVLTLMLYLKSLGIESQFPQTDRPSYVVMAPEEIEKRFKKPARGICVNGQVYIASTVNLNTCVGKAILLHELAHYTQGYCPIAPSWADYLYREKFAYSVQNRYLKDNGCGNYESVPGSEGVTEFYERPRDKDSERGYNSKAAPEPQPENADVIRKRMEAAERKTEKRNTRGFHSRFEDEDFSVDTGKIKEYNSRTR